MLTTRRCVRVEQAAASPLCFARRHIRHHHSPDRTYSQEIQDRQNTFQWASRHIFRPHQHFSYDPSNWSRRLEEKMKQQQKLSLVERVRQAAERDAERSANRVAVQQAAEDAPPSSSPPQPQAEEEDVPSYFFSSDDVSHTAPNAPSEDVPAPLTSWDAVSLQELIEELQRLEALLYRRRYAGNASLARRRHQQDEFRTLLFQLLERLSGAVLGVDVTVDACACGWFTLLQHVESLAEELAARTADTGGISEAPLAPQDAVQRIFAALQSGLLLPMERGGVVHSAAAEGKLSLEALIELLSVAAAPFVRNCGDVFQQTPLSTAALLDYAAWVATAAHVRAREGVDPEEDGGAALREWVDPAHLHAWAVATRHLQRRGASTSTTVAHLVPSLVLQVGHAALYVTRTLENVTGATLRGRVKESLHRTPRQLAHGTRRGGEEEEEEERVQGVVAPKAVVLDVTAPPRGVQTAPTACDDVGGVLSAATALLLVMAQRTTETAAGEEESRLRRLVAGCLQMTAHAPNYDLEGAAVVSWACAVLESGVLLQAVAAAEEHNADDRRQAPRPPTQDGVEDGVRLSLRLLLLLSRFTFIDVTDRPSLGRLVLHITQWPEPEGCTATERREWRRLRGVVMRNLLELLTCEDLCQAAEGVEGAPSWVEAVAYGEYDGVVPPPVWRAACERWVPSPCSRDAAAARDVCTPSVAQALLLLCMRYLAREDASWSAAVVNLRSLHTAELVARCVAVTCGDLHVADALLRSADAWEGVCEGLPVELHELCGAMREVVRRETAQTKVMNF